MTVKIYGKGETIAPIFYEKFNEKAHTRQHLLNGENTNYWYTYEYQKVKYVDHYTCECGMTKAGEPKPKDE